MSVSRHMARLKWVDGCHDNKCHTADVTAVRAAPVSTSALTLSLPTVRAMQSLESTHFLACRYAGGQNVVSSTHALCDQPDTVEVLTC